MADVAAGRRPLPPSRGASAGADPHDLPTALHSQVPGWPSFRSSALNSVAIVPLLSTDGQTGAELSGTHSERSFNTLMAGLGRYAKTGGDEPVTSRAFRMRQREDRKNGSSGDDDDDAESNAGGAGAAAAPAKWADELSETVLVIPNSQLTRPGDWRYDRTPLRSHDWSNGCQRLRAFDGRCGRSRAADDRLVNADVVHEWINLVPSKGTAAVVGVLNIRDCRNTEMLHQAEAELRVWADRYSCQRVGGSAMPSADQLGQEEASEENSMIRMFVFDSFDEESQRNVDLSDNMLGSDLVAFPPSDDKHTHMMDLHLNVVVNDLAVAIFRQLEISIRRLVRGKGSGVGIGGIGGGVAGAAGAAAANFFRGGRGGQEQPAGPSAPSGLSITAIANVINPGGGVLGSEDNDEDGEGKGESDGAGDESKVGGIGKGFKAASAWAAAARAIKSETFSPGSSISSASLKARLSTPLDGSLENRPLTHRELEQLARRDTGRREKLAADLSLLAGSPVDAYERYTRAAELTRSGHDPLWYASSLHGCAAAFVAMAEAGGHGVDGYLENNFQLPEEIMALAFAAGQNPSDGSGGGSGKRSGGVDRTKTTLPAAVFALADEALDILARHPSLAALHAELLLKLAWYKAEVEERHLRCRWGEGEECYGGDVATVGANRWEMTSVSHNRGNIAAIAFLTLAPSTT